MPDRLSPRQLECLRLSATMNDKEIARALGLSPHTVNQHIRDALSRLGVSSRKAALRRLTSNPLPPPDGMGVDPRQLDATGASADPPQVSEVAAQPRADAREDRDGRWGEPPRVLGSRLPLILAWAAVGLVALIVIVGLMVAFLGDLQPFAPGAS